MTTTPSPNQVAIVTGAADGIGWATARRLALDYGHVVVADLRADAAERRAAELGAGHAGLGCDVSKEEDVVRLVQEVMARFGRIDVLVNNAGNGPQTEMTLEQSVEDFDRILGVHLRGTVLASREVARIFVAQQCGAIVNISSIAGLQAHPGRNAYGAAKSGISNMTQAMAGEWARDGIRVNAVAPGTVMTELVKHQIAKGAQNPESAKTRLPMGRFGEPAEIAEVIAFLASPRASFVTGVTLSVDCGWLAFGAPPARLGTVAEMRAKT